MQTIFHSSDKRGKGEHDWLSTRYSFSFADWYDKDRMGFGTLRVINDDQIAAHNGFPPHAHADMEIITVVTSGTLTHGDSIGNTGTIQTGDVQVMSAGTGVIHYEKNGEDEPLSLYQIWILPKEKGIAPRYDQKQIPLDTETPGLQLLVGPMGMEDTLTINQDAYLYRGVVSDSHQIQYIPKDEEHGVYVFVTEGTVTVADYELTKGDGLGILEAGALALSSRSSGTFLLFEVPRGF